MSLKQWKCLHKGSCCHDVVWCLLRNKTNTEMVMKTLRSNFTLPVGAIVLALLFRGYLLTRPFFVLRHLWSPSALKIAVQWTVVCISAQKSNTTSQNSAILKLHDGDEILEEKNSAFTFLVKISATHLQSRIARRRSRACYSFHFVGKDGLHHHHHHHHHHPKTAD